MNTYNHLKSKRERGWERGRKEVQIPEGMDAIYNSRHILSIVQVGGDWIKNLKIYSIKKIQSKKKLQLNSNPITK